MSKDRATAKLVQLYSLIPQGSEELANWKVEAVEKDPETYPDVFMINQRTGKKYKINLTEV